MEPEIRRVNVANLSFAEGRAIFRHYLWINKWPWILFVLTVILGMTRFFNFSSLAPWKNWEVAALGYTIIYTGIIYFDGLMKNYFNNIDGRIVALLFIPFLGLSFSFILSLGAYSHLFNFTLDRRWSMCCLWITTFFFVVVDFILFKELSSRLPRVSKAYLQSLKFSDFPIFIAFAALTAYAFYIGKDEIDREHMDSFFSGTIAFQMMLSNIIWTLTDDVFLEPIPSAGLPSSPTG